MRDLRQSARQRGRAQKLAELKLTWAAQGVRGAMPRCRLPNPRWCRVPTRKPASTPVSISSWSDTAAVPPRPLRPLTPTLPSPYDPGGGAAPRVDRGAGRTPGRYRARSAAWASTRTAPRNSSGSRDLNRTKPGSEVLTEGRERAMTGGLRDNPHRLQPRAATQLLDASRQSAAPSLTIARTRHGTIEHDQ
jgi:hypothetical protein